MKQRSNTLVKNERHYQSEEEYDKVRWMKRMRRDRFSGIAEKEVVKKKRMRFGVGMWKRLTASNLEDGIATSI